MPLSHTCTDGATGNRDPIWTRFSATWGRNWADSPSAPRRSKTSSASRVSCTRSWRPPSAALLAHELEQLDVDRPAVTIAGQRYHRVLRSTATYTSAGGSGYRAAHLVPRRLRAGSGSVGAASGHHRGPLDAARGAPSDLSGGSSDAPGGCRYAARVRQHESLEEQPGPAPEAAEQPLGEAPRGVRGGVAGGGNQCLVQRPRWRYRWME